MINTNTDLRVIKLVFEGKKIDEGCLLYQYELKSVMNFLYFRNKKLYARFKDFIERIDINTGVETTDLK